MCLGVVGHFLYISVPQVFFILPLYSLLCTAADISIWKKKNIKKTRLEKVLFNR